MPKSGARLVQRDVPTMAVYILAALHEGQTTLLNEYINVTGCYKRTINNLIKTQVIFEKVTLNVFVEIEKWCVYVHAG